MERIRFVYLSYTVHIGQSPDLLGVYASNKDAKSWFDLVEGESAPIGRSNRVMQKYSEKTGQIWYVEKHVIRAGR